MHAGRIVFAQRTIGRADGGVDSALAIQPLTRAMSGYAVDINCRLGINAGDLPGFRSATVIVEARELASSLRHW